MIAERAIADACTGSNPRPISAEEMKEVFLCAYYGKRHHVLSAFVSLKTLPSGKRAPNRALFPRLVCIRWAFHGLQTFSLAARTRFGYTVGIRDQSANIWTRQRLLPCLFHGMKNHIFGGIWT